jgi:hypothetical protein
MIPLLLVIITFASIFAMAGGYIGLALEHNPNRLNKTICWISTIAFIGSIAIIMAWY